MAQLVFFGSQISARMLARARAAGNSLDDANAGSFELRDFVRIIRKQANGAKPESLQRFGGEFVVARVVRKPELPVRFHRVKARVLQLVRLQLIDQANTAPFLRQIQQDSRWLACDFPQRKFKLRPAVATLGRKNVSRKALRMDANERRLSIAASNCRAGSRQPLLLVSVPRFRKFGIGRSLWATSPLATTRAFADCFLRFIESIIIAGFAGPSLRELRGTIRPSFSLHRRRALANVIGESW